MRYLAIDYGTVRSGLAVSDYSETFVSPLKVIKSKKQLIPEIKRIIKQEHIEAVVIGLPLNMDDSYGPQAKITKEFAKRLEKEIDVPVQYYDERLSTFGAEEKLGDFELTNKKRKKILDAIAAAEILKSFIESKAAENGGKNEQSKNQ